MIRDDQSARGGERVRAAREDWRILLDVHRTLAGIGYRSRRVLMTTRPHRRAAEYARILARIAPRCAADVLAFSREESSSRQPCVPAVVPAAESIPVVINIDMGGSIPGGRWTSSIHAIPHRCAPVK